MPLFDVEIVRQNLANHAVHFFRRLRPNPILGKANNPTRVFINPGLTHVRLPETDSTFIIIAHRYKKESPAMQGRMFRLFWGAHIREIDTYPQPYDTGGEIPTPLHPERS